MTIEDAINNIRIVVSKARMTADEHTALAESINNVVTRIKDLEEDLREKKND